MVSGLLLPWYYCITIVMTTTANIADIISKLFLQISIKSANCYVTDLIPMQFAAECNFLRSAPKWAVVATRLKIITRKKQEIHAVYCKGCCDT